MKHKYTDMFLATFEILMEAYLKTCSMLDHTNANGSSYDFAMAELENFKRWIQEAKGQDNDY